MGTSLMIQWLRLHAPNAEGPGLIHGRGSSLQLESSRATLKTQCSQNR